MALHLFCYGSLTLAPIMRAVTGTLPASCPALLGDFSLSALAGEPFPAVVPHAGQHVRGLVYLHLRPLLLRRLDRYEGEMYRRVRVTPTLADGNRIEAWTYVLRMRYHHRCERRQWCMQKFLHRHAKPCLHRL